MSDKQWILAELKKGRALTTWDCIMERGCTRAPARIYELIKAGHDIVKKMVYTTDRFGNPTHYAQYKLREE